MNISNPGTPTPGFRNLLVNGDFSVNQRNYASGASLATGDFAHDRWVNKGAAGSSYTFTQGQTAELAASASVDTTINLSGGGGLSQNIEARRIVGGVYTLSWVGTAPLIVYYYNAGVGYVSVGSGSSPLTVALPAGATTRVTVNGNGTLGQVQLEAGAIATPFERRPRTVELLFCQRYYQQVSATQMVGQAISATTIRFAGAIPVPMRAAPTVALATTSVSSGTNDLLVGGTYVSAATLALAASAMNGTSVTANISGFSGLTAGQAAMWNITGVLLTLNAEF